MKSFLKNIALDFTLTALITEDDDRSCAGIETCKLTSLSTDDCDDEIRAATLPAAVVCTSIAFVTDDDDDR